MDDEIESLVVRVHADTAGFARDVDAMRGSLDGPLADTAARAGRGIESALVRAVRTGKLGFEDLGRTAMSILSQIATSTVRGGIDSVFGGGLGTVLGGLLGAPGRATGGPVSPGRAYAVGERGPEIFVPTTSGHVVATGQPGGRDVRVAITINAPAGESSRALQQSSRQVARAVRAAIEGAA
ncbi:tail tape measure protein [Hephaestia sp. GCM10023244]|uniref:tail tape measure protein n=1 Tax=unclassified Hephaestia TaxID=2631281 RepID=UPI002077647E|nr:tail tape measure protein [Hephaestia sp. MAHUQ-44]MCM8729706.1 tail tape measure protein [Hephaestia sp. MAHUQ-44]